MSSNAILAFSGPARGVASARIPGRLVFRVRTACLAIWITMRTAGNAAMLLVVHSCGSVGVISYAWMVSFKRTRPLVLAVQSLRVHQDGYQRRVPLKQTPHVSRALGLTAWSLSTGVCFVARRGFSEIEHCLRRASGVRSTSHVTRASFHQLVHLIRIRCASPVLRLPVLLSGCPGVCFSVLLGSWPTRPLAAIQRRRWCIRSWKLP